MGFRLQRRIISFTFIAKRLWNVIEWISYFFMYNLSSLQNYFSALVSLHNVIGHVLVTCRSIHHLSNNVTISWTLQVTLLQVVVVVSNVTWSHGQMAIIISKWCDLLVTITCLITLLFLWSHEHMAEAIEFTYPKKIRLTEW